jgi:hypothetical protein
MSTENGGEIVEDCSSDVDESETEGSVDEEALRFRQ